MFSVYGSADTGLLGFESPASVILRKICMADPLVAEDLGLGRVIPHFFHHADPGAYVETVGSELCVTKWQGIPLVHTTCTTATTFTTGRTSCGCCRPGRKETRPWRQMWHVWANAARD